MESQIAVGVPIRISDATMEVFENGKYFQQKEAVTPLILATIHNKVKKVKELIDIKENVDAKTECGNTALHYAAFMGYADIINILIHAGANVNIANNANQTPLNVAIVEKMLFVR